MPAPAFVDLEPMLAGEVKRPFSSPEWAFEVKYDGYRALAEWSGSTARLKSRRGVDMTAWFQEVAMALGSLGGARSVVDGEICVLNDAGIAGDQEFKRLFARSSRRGYKPGDPLVTYVVFDIMVAAGSSLMERPLRHRRQVIEEMFEGVPQVRVVDQVPEHGEAMYRAALELGLEGIVAKRLDSTYQPGRRSRDWLKIKRPGAVPAERFDHR